MVVGWCTRSCGCSCTVRTMPLVIVREDLGAVGQTWIVDWVVECNDFRVVCGRVVVLIVKTGVVSIDTCIDDGHGCTRAVVTCLCPSRINTVQDGSIAVRDREDAIKFEHDNAWELRCFKDVTDWNSTSERINAFQCPLMTILNSLLKHLDFSITGRE